MCTNMDCSDCFRDCWVYNPAHGRYFQQFALTNCPIADLFRDFDGLESPARGVLETITAREREVD